MSEHCWVCMRLFQQSVMVNSGVKVWFSPVQHPLCLNLELDFQFGSDNSLNFELDLQFRFSSVQTWFKPFKIITKEFLLKRLLFTTLSTYLHCWVLKHVWSFTKSVLHHEIMTLMPIAEALTTTKYYVILVILSGVPILAVPCLPISNK